MQRMQDLLKIKKCLAIRGFTQTIRRSRRILFIACDTIIIPVWPHEVCLKASELASVFFLGWSPPISRDDICVFVSQLGKTADTILVLCYCLKLSTLCVDITNTVESSISRETHCGVHINAGPEIGVASTKAYASQYISLLSVDTTSKESRCKEIIDGLYRLPGHIKEFLALDHQFLEIAIDRLGREKSLLILVHGYQSATCLEGALKIKDTVYTYIEGIFSSKFKHGLLALIDERMPVILLMTLDSLYPKVQSSLQQVRTRKKILIIICNTDDQNLIQDPNTTIQEPKTVNCLQGLINSVPFQLLSYHMTVIEEVDVDFPRNLVKSITVE
ncbi:unnamed protein product [Rhizopus stolonifer]